MVHFSPVQTTGMDQQYITGAKEESYTYRNSNGGRGNGCASSVLATKSRWHRISASSRQFQTASDAQLLQARDSAGAKCRVKMPSKAAASPDGWGRPVLAAVRRSPFAEAPTSTQAKAASSRSDAKLDGRDMTIALCPDSDSDRYYTAAADQLEDAPAPVKPVTLCILHAPKVKPVYLLRYVSQRDAANQSGLDPGLHVTTSDIGGLQTSEHQVHPAIGGPPDEIYLVSTTWVAEASVVRVQHQRARYKRMRSALVLAAVLQMLIMLSMTPSFLAQPVAMGNGSEGCLQKVPSAPTNVQAKVKDGAVLLSWSPPEDGSCVATYIVDVYDPGLRSSGPVQSASTDGHSLALDGLQNGKLYQFRVQAFNAVTGGTGVANIQATPTDLCLNQPPGKPTNLRVTPAKGMAQLCWSGVENNACVDQYRVSAVKTAEANFRSGFGSLPVSKGGCANISSLTDGVQYTFSVVAVSNANGQSPAASTTAFVGSAVAAQNGWKCNPMPGCRPNSVSMCSLLGCQGTANMGGCKGPGMYDLSYLDKKVTQWCSQACACDTSVSAVFSPLSWGISTGIMNGVNSLLGMNPAPSPVMAQSSSQLSAALSNGLKNGVNSLLGQAADSTRAAPGLPQGLIAGLLAGNGGERAGGAEGAPMLGAGLLQNVAASGVVGNMLGQTMGELTTSVVSGLVNTVVEGVQPSRPSTDDRPDRLVIVDEFRTSRVNSTVHARQPCELHLPPDRPRPADRVPPAGQDNPRLRIGESMQRPLELCSWKDREALPPIGKEYQQGYKRVNDRRPKSTGGALMAEARNTTCVGPSSLDRLSAIVSVKLSALAVVSDVPDCQGVAYAQQQGIPVLTYPIPKKGGFPGLTAAQLVDGLKNNYKADFVLLAGYLKLIPAELVRAFPRAMLNIHPGLLPSFGGKGMYGHRVHEAVVASGVRFTGPTVHFVDEGFDTGPILAQRVVAVNPLHSPAQVAALVLQQEHKVYPEAVAALVDGRISWREDGIPIMWTSQ
ncbi:hypothetical protein QJQ45_012136 [Haematococcus lacustris]|nr:hypothetical protein QJQ45_012136 [Haematococcus lacustris]